MNSTPKSRLVIIGAVATTGEADGAVVSTVAGLARTFEGAELHFLHVIDAPQRTAWPYGSAVPERARSAQLFMAAISRHVEEQVVGKVFGHTAVGAPAKQILALATDLEADLIVVGSHSKSALSRTVGGSVSASVVRQASCAVLVARPKTYTSEAEIHYEIPPAFGEGSMFFRP